MCDCILTSTQMPVLVSVADFNGTCTHTAIFSPEGTVLSVAYSHPTAFWADYDAVTGVVHFGGDWQHVPHMLAKKQATEIALQRFVKRHGGNCQRRDELQ